MAQIYKKRVLTWVEKVTFLGKLLLD